MKSQDSRLPRRSRVAWLSTALEVLVVFLWTILVTGPYVNLDPTRSPAGSEFLGNIQTHHAWSWLTGCGPCAFWFGNSDGGWPVAADVNSATFHPLVALTTLVWGVLNGSKIALVAVFLMAGLAQWWLARVLGVGRVARTWSACMAVVAGHLASRMDLGSLTMVLSTTAAALVWPPLIALCRDGRRRDAVWLGITLGLLALSGNGYMQVGTAFLLPVTLLLLGRKSIRLAPRFFLAAGIAFLIAAPVLLPFAHFFGEFDKAVEPTFSWSQPLAYVPLNLVISDHSFYLIKALGHEPYSSPYVLFVGWVPVLLALWGMGDSRGGERLRERLFLAALAILSFWLASAGPFKLLLKVLPLPPLMRLLSGVRNTAFLAGLAVLPILGLSAIGLDRLLKARWRGDPSARPGGPPRILSLRWLLLIPLVLALRAARDFGKPSIRLLPPFPPYTAGVLSSLQTPDSQWVSTPRGEHYWIEPALARGLKLANNAYLTWHWLDRPSPEPVLAASYSETFPGMAPKAIVSGIRIFAAPPGREYAIVSHGNGTRTRCDARGTGGDIDVLCDTPSPGVLIVRENSWSGWGARIAGHQTPLLPGRWLSVALPGGRNTIQFRYRPWDLPLGLLLCLAGWGLASGEMFRDWRDGRRANASARLAAGR